jgi:hypothetical protein
MSSSGPGRSGAAPLLLTEDGRLRPRVLVTSSPVTAPGCLTLLLGESGSRATLDAIASALLDEDHTQLRRLWGALPRRSGERLRGRSTRTEGPRVELLYQERPIRGAAVPGPVRDLSIRTVPYHGAPVDPADFALTHPLGTPGPPPAALVVLHPPSRSRLERSILVGGTESDQARTDLLDVLCSGAALVFGVGRPAPPHPPAGGPSARQGPPARSIEAAPPFDCTQSTARLIGLAGLPRAS